MSAARPKRSGPSLSDTRRAQLGYGRMELRIPSHELELLRAESLRSGLSRSELVASAIRLYVGDDAIARDCRGGVTPPARKPKRR